jgi:hypothetical protein
MFSGTGLTALEGVNLSRTSFALDMDTMDFSGMLLLRFLDLRFMPNLVGTLNPLWGEWMPRMQEFYMAGALNVVCDQMRQQATYKLTPPPHHMFRQGASRQNSILADINYQQHHMHAPRNCIRYRQLGVHRSMQSLSCVAVLRVAAAVRPG